MNIYTCAFAFCSPYVLLIRKAKPEWQKGLLNGIGGKVEEGETIIGATVREFREETGLYDIPVDPQIFHAMFWWEYETHYRALVYFSALDIPHKSMLEAVSGTVNSVEPCVIVKVDNVNYLNGQFMPNLPFLIEMATCLYRCTPEQRKLRQPVVFEPAVYHDYVENAPISEHVHGGS